MRKAFTEFFKDRGCLFFVRPVNDEKKLRSIEKLEFEDLRSEFRKAINIFKERVHNKLKPKKYNGKVLTGKSFANLIKEILENFNSNKIPHVKDSIERIFE